MFEGLLGSSRQISGYYLAYDTIVRFQLCSTSSLTTHPSIGNVQLENKAKEAI